MIGLVRRPCCGRQRPRQGRCGARATCRARVVAVVAASSSPPLLLVVVVVVVVMDASRFRRRWCRDDGGQPAKRRLTPGLRDDSGKCRACGDGRGGRGRRDGPALLFLRRAGSDRCALAAGMRMAGDDLLLLGTGWAEAAAAAVRWSLEQREREREVRRSLHGHDAARRARQLFSL